MSKSLLISSLDKICRKAGRFLVRDFAELEMLQAARDNKRFVAKALERTARILIEELQKLRPDYAINVDGEEVFSGKGSNVFLVNVLDGVENFARANPFFAMVIVVRNLQTAETEATIGYAPALGEFYYAEKGKGSWFEKVSESQQNTLRSRVSYTKDLIDSLFAAGAVQDAKGLAILNQILAHAKDVRMLGSDFMAMAMVAAGKLDFYCGTTNNVTSIASGEILVREAGGFIITNNDKKTTIYGKDLLVVSNAHFVKVLENIFLH